MPTPRTVKEMTQLPKETQKNVADKQIKKHKWTSKAQT